MRNFFKMSKFIENYRAVEYNHKRLYISELCGIKKYISRF